MSTARRTSSLARSPTRSQSDLRLRQPGQAIVEFGIVSILFILLLFGMVDFGLLLNGWLTISSNSREAARVASRRWH